MDQKWRRLGNLTHAWALVSNSSVWRSIFDGLIALDTFMSKTARLYQDTRTATAASGSKDGNLGQLNNELQDVTRIMTKNMEELLWRGDSLDSKSFCVF
jgi:hypothetical protein